MTRIILSLLCNSIVACWTIVAVVQTVRRNGREAGNSAAAFRYFTTDSNVLSGVAALLIAICDVRLLVLGDTALPAWVVLIKYAGTAAVAVTFLTVMVFLGPASSYRELFADEGLFLHLIGPLLAVLSFCFLDGGAAVAWGQLVFGALPTLLYGVLYLVMVVYRGEGKGGWEDFYGFNKGGKWPISMTVMFLGAFAISALLLALHNLS